MRNGYSYNDCFRIGNKYHVFISSDCKIFNLNDITGFESAQINFNGLNQSFRQCFICDLFQLLFNYTGLDFLMVYKYDLCNRVNFFTFDQCLEIHLDCLTLQSIKVDLLDQYIILLSFQIQHNLTAFLFLLQKTISFGLCDLNRNGTFDVMSEDITGYISFSSQSFCFCFHASLFSF